jgi:citrate/tricarballylate utilization protein
MSGARSANSAAAQAATKSLFDKGEFVMNVCNACRYCEQYCPVFPAMEQRVTFGRGDLLYLANLCHNCGECLYACQYAPPHEFGINVPQTLAAIRIESYEQFCWPSFMGSAFRKNGALAALVLAGAFSLVLYLVASSQNPAAFRNPSPQGDFYAVVPHDAMVTMFGGVAAYVLIAFGIGLRRFWRVAATVVPGAGRATRPASAALQTLRDVLTLRHLHTTGVDCTVDEEVRTPWRRWFHHCTFYGFMLCFASTSVAAIYHLFFGWIAPYDYTSVPVVLGTAGGVGLLVGPAGLLALRRRRDPELSAPGQQGIDRSLIVLLFVTSATGLAVMVWRNAPIMPQLLIVHLGAVLALFVTLPYGKFVHAIYRVAALAKFSRES